MPPCRRTWWKPTTASITSLWQVIEGIGGERGWYSFPLAWEARGFLDRLAGGVGLRRGRRHPDHVYVGESLDFWRVEERIPNLVLRLRAEMRLPGLAWLELGIKPDPVTYRQRAVFYPRGLWGHLYWKLLTPVHGIIFGSMARNIVREAETLDGWVDEQTLAPSPHSSSSAQVR